MLRGRKIALTPLIESDSTLLYHWINDPEVVHFNSVYKPIHELAHRRWFEAICQRQDVYLFGIRDLASDTLIGSCQLHSVDVISRSVELQIRIGDERARGQGAGTEAIRMLLKFAYEDLNLHRVYLHVFATNERAIRAYCKSGFTQEGRLRQAAFVSGQFVDVIVMAALRTEWTGETVA